MDLAELKFVVDTKQLEDAAKKVADLGTEVSKLNKPMQNLTRESAKTNKELSKAEEAAAKAALAQTKLEQAQTKSTQAAAKSSSVLERQNLILEYMAQGNSKGQASILATAKAAGALDDEMLELNKTLVTQRTLIGGDPFDKSIGLMQKLQNEYKTTTEVTNLFNKNLGLTEKQMTDLAREKERLIALYGIEGKSLNGLAAEYEQLIQKSAMINQANDARTNSMKAQVKAENDATRANEYLAKEMERVNRLNSEGADITSATNNRLIRFERELRASGVSAAEAATKLDAYKNALLSAQKVAGNRQIDYLSRALGPQITDIAVGLATGQAPLTILLQQGGQLRDQFALAGVAGADMGKMLIEATKSMVVSVKDVGVAIGSAFVGAIAGAGKSVTNFAMQITGANLLLDIFRAKIIATAGEGSFALKAFDLLGKSIVAFAGIITFTAIAALVAFGVAMSDVIKEENALNRALNLTGAAMGVSLDAAYSAAKGMEELGVSTGTALEVLTEMSKIGGMSASSLETVATTAKALKTAFDIPIADTVKKFKELQEKPTESLTKLAQQLGTIPVEILKQVQAYEKAGDTIKAAELATKSYADAGKDAADRTVENFGTITRLGISLGKIWSATWESIMGVGRVDTNDEKITNLSKRLATLLAAKDPRQIANRKPMVDATIAEIQSIALQIAKEKELAEQRQKNSEAASKFETDNKKKTETAKKETKELTELEKERIQFLKVMSDIEDRASGFTKNYSDQLKSLNIGLTEGWLNQDEFNIKLHELNKVQPGVIKAHKDHADALEKFTQAQKKADDALFDSLDVQHQLNMQVLQQTDLLALEASLIGATDAERKKALATKRLDLQLEKEIADIKKSPISASEQEAQIARARQRRVDSEKNLNTEIANDAATKTLEEYNKIKDGVADSIVTALFEGGKAGSKKLRDLIVAQLREKITLTIDALVNVGMNALIGGGSKGGSFAESIVGSFLQKQIGGIAVGGTTLGAAAGAFGQGVLSGFSTGAPVASMGSATSGAFNAGATYGAPVAGAIGGIAANKVISQDYEISKTMTDLQNVATVAAAFIPGLGPLVALGVGVVSGLTNRAFGMKAKEITGEGIVGTLTTQGADVKAFEDWFQKGGWFRSNKSGRNLSAVSSSLQEYLDVSLFGVTASTKAYAAALGLEAKDIDSVTKTIDLNLKGLSAEDRQKKIDEALGGFSDELAKKLGYESFEALQKLGEEVLKERYDLETQLLTLQGDTTALRARERDQIYETNKGLFDQIKALEDKKAADEKAAEAMQKLTDVTTSIVDEINRLRGVNTSKSDLESQFAILTAQARSGDLTALAKLPEITKGLEQVAASTAVNATDIIFARAKLAQSLQDTLGYTDGFTASATTSMASIGSVSASGTSVSSNVTSASSNQELLAALVVEVQGLRAEVRADVSHNAKTAKILERVNQDGESLTITTLV
jgi:phage-related minor tail protein